MSDDLPTPPLPLATASTRVVASTEMPLRPLGDAAAELRRERGLLLGRHHVERERDALDPVERQRARGRPAPGSSARSGHPATVSAIVTATRSPIPAMSSTTAPSSCRARATAAVGAPGVDDRPSRSQRSRLGIGSDSLASSTAATGRCPRWSRRDAGSARPARRARSGAARPPSVRIRARPRRARAGSTREERERPTVGEISSGRIAVLPRSRAAGAAAMSTLRIGFSETTASMRPAARWQSESASEPMIRNARRQLEERRALSAT